MKQIEASRRKAKPLWFRAVCPETGKGQLFLAENGFQPKAGETVPAKMISDWGENGCWVVDIVFSRQFQRLMAIHAAFDHFSDGEGNAGATGIFMVISEAMNMCIAAERRRNQRALPTGVTVEMLRELPAGSVLVLATLQQGREISVPRVLEVQSA